MKKTLDKKNENIKMGKRWYFIIGYGIVVVILFLFIVFWAPSKWFQKKVDLPKIEIHECTLKEQMEHLLNNQYEYEYNILYVDTETYHIYMCSGKLDKTTESGTCTSPKQIEYNNETKQEVLGDLNNDYLDLQKLFEFLEDKSYTEKEYEGTKVYVYNIKINSLETDVELYSDDDNIIEIRIDNFNEHYQLKYSNILY